MRVYVETNFVLELAFRQEQVESCREILGRCEAGGVRLVLPAFSIVEAFQAAVAREKERGDVAAALRKQIGQLARITALADLIPLDADVLRAAEGLERALRLSAQDAVVLASVLGHLERSPAEACCFLNRNVKDFDDPDVLARLDRFGCKLFPRFDSGAEYLGRPRPG